MKNAHVGARIVLLTTLLACGSAFAHQEPAPAGSAGPGEVVARLPWGEGAAAVGGGPGSQNAPAVVESAPASFAGDDTGAVYILDTINKRIVILKPGAEPANVSLAALGGDANPGDFAVRGKSWLVVDRKSQSVVEIGPDGTAGTRWTGFQRVHRVDVNGEQVLARDETALSVSRLAAGGKVEEVSASPHANTVVAGGGPVLARVVGDHAVFTIGPENRVMALAAHQAGDEVHGVEVAGVDAKGALILAIEEGKGDERRGVWLSRIGADGDVQAELLVPPVDENYTEMAHFFRALPDGRVLQFHTTTGAYELVRHTLTPPSPVRTATLALTPKAATEAARAALEKGDKESARTALVAQAISVAFDETVSRRVERDLASLAAGAPPAALVALSAGQAALESGDAAKALSAVASVDGPGVKDRRLYIEAQALEKQSDWREALRRWQRLVLDHADSPNFAEAQASVLRIVDSGKLPGAQPK